MKGYTGRMLRVNLTHQTIAVETPLEEFYRSYIGGRGFIVPILLKEVPALADPLGADNKLLFTLGPFTGHLIGSGKNSIGAKSPLTGGLGESEVGGFWGVELRKAGFDAIIIEGVSKTPVYIAIRDGIAEIRDASKIWGLEVAKTQAAIRTELGDDKIRTAVIGPGGERLIRYSSIFNDISHVAGRNGMGAVMGSKKLKAIAIRGMGMPAVADRGKIQELAQWMGANYKEKTRFWEFGTGAIMDRYEKSGNLPIRNFKGGWFPNAEKVSAQQMFKKSYVEKMDNCFGCPVRCKKRVRLEAPWNVDPEYGGPEYETLAAMGCNCGIDDLESVIKAHELCGRYGIDTISTGVCIAFAMECFEKGILTLADTDGLQLNFGNAAAMLEMIERIAFRKGLGDLLAEGSKRAAEKIGKGSIELAMQVKGQEIPMHEPRYRQGLGLHYSTHFGGADHGTGVFDDQIGKLLSDAERKETIPPTTGLSPHKVALVYTLGLWRQATNYLGICFFVPWTNRHMNEAMAAVTGWAVDSDTIPLVVERGVTLARIFNLREGFSAKDDRLPSRFHESPAEGPLCGIRIDKQELARAQKEYYEMLGWDEAGVPLMSKLEALGIAWAGKYLPGSKQSDL
jgi:aldehyde:ferredoxin oxidoreductase